MRRVELLFEVRHRATPNADGHQSDRGTAESMPPPTLDDGVGLFAWFNGGIVASAVDWRVDPCTAALMAFAPDVVLRSRRRACPRRRATRPSGPHQASLPSRETPPPYRRPILPAPTSAVSPMAAEHDPTAGTEPRPSATVLARGLSALSQTPGSSRLGKFRFTTHFDNERNMLGTGGGDVGVQFPVGGDRGVESFPPRRAPRRTPFTGGLVVVVREAWTRRGRRAPRRSCVPR